MLLFAAVSSSAGTVFCSCPVLFIAGAILSDKAPDHFRGIVDHRNDPGVVESSGADDPDRADNLLPAVVIGRDHHRAAGDPKEVALGANKDLHALCLLAGV